MNMHKIAIQEPTGENFEFCIPTARLREIMAETILGGIQASQEIEGEPALEFPSIEELARRIPNSMLTT